MKPIELETKKISREGDVGLEFNHKMRVPEIITQKPTKDSKQRLLVQSFSTCPVTQKRRLVGLSELDVSRDIMDVTFVTQSDQETTPIKYYLDMTKWDEKGLGIKVNFDDPLQVGKGSDQIMTSLKDPSMFVSQESESSIPKNKATSVKEAKT